MYMYSADSLQCATASRTSALISVNYPFSQTPANTARPRTHHVMCLFTLHLSLGTYHAYPRRVGSSLVDLRAWFCAEVHGLPVIRGSSILVLTGSSVE